MRASFSLAEKVADRDIDGDIYHGFRKLRAVLVKVMGCL